MKEDEVNKYAGKKVLIILKNDFKYTVTLPYEIGESFSVTDRYGANITISCDMIGLIKEVQE